MKQMEQKVAEAGMAGLQGIFRFHRDRSGSMIAISAIFTLVIVILLSVTINLAHVTHKKIQAQNAADAAAMAAGIWQVRSLAFAQTMNNAVVYSDGIAFSGLTLAAVLGTTAHFDPTPISQGLGNVALGFAVAGHAISQWGILPFRHAFVFYIAPGLAYASASNLAGANHATPLSEGIPGFLGALGGEIPLVSELTEGASKILGAIGLDSVRAASLSILRSGQDEPKLIWDLGLSYAEPVKEVGEGSASAKIPLIPINVPDKVLNPLFNLTYSLPMHKLALKYFDGNKRIGEILKGKLKSLHETGAFDNLPDELRLDNIVPTGKWSHRYLKTEANFPENEPVLVRYEPTTWLTVVRATDRSEGLFRGWSEAWRPMGGLGQLVVRIDGSTQYVELGAIGVAAVRVFADPVLWFRPGNFKGWVELVPIPEADREILGTLTTGNALPVLH